LAKIPNRLHSTKSTSVATGPAGPIPHADYCAPQCYSKGKPEFSKDCQCKGCQGDAHGRGKKYAFDHGYLKYSLPRSRKLGSGQELLFSTEETDSVEVIDSPHTVGS
jgi:hypothetical protein